MTSQAIMGIIGGATQTIIGGYQTYKGIKAMKELGDRPEYQIPTGVDSYVNVAEQLAYEGLTNEQKANFMKEVQRSEAAMLNASGSLNSQLAGASAAKISSNDAIGDMYAKDAAARIQGRQNLMDAYLTKAEYEDEKYRQDLTTYLDERDTAMSMIGAGTQNIVGGFDTAAGASSGFGQAKSGSQTGDYYNEEANKSMEQHEKEVEEALAAGEDGSGQYKSGADSGDDAPGTYKDTMDDLYGGGTAYGLLGGYAPQRKSNGNMVRSWQIPIN